MDFENLEELKTLRARGVLSEEQFERHYNRMAQRVLNDRKEEARSKTVWFICCWLILPEQSGCTIFTPVIINAVAFNCF